MNVREIVANWLAENSYDGLCSDDCGCDISDLMPCDKFAETCVPGYKVPCMGPNFCPADGDCPWHISPAKPDKPYTGD